MAKGFLANFFSGIFGSDGSAMTRTGGTLSDGKTLYHKTGSMTYGSDGSSIQTLGGMSYLSSGERIQRIGNSWHTSRGIYQLTGSMLYGPDGKSWSGVRPEDVPIIIQKNM